MPWIFEVVGEDADPDPPRRPARLRLSPRTLAVGAIGVLFAASVGVLTYLTIHYHQQANRAPRLLTAPTPTVVEATPKLARSSYSLLGGKLQVDLVAVSSITGSRGSLVIDAWLFGGKPGTRYELSGGDCASPMRNNNIWAAGTANSAGTAHLTGPTWNLPADDKYFLDLQPWPFHPSQNPIIGLTGDFLYSQASPIPAVFPACE